jgi:hypothetical protein
VIRDFAAFLSALWHEWKILLTGGSIVAVLALLSFGGVKSIPQYVNWLIIGVTFVMAVFHAWRNERTNVARTKRDVSTEVPVPASAPERIVIDVTPEYLMGFYKEHTDVQAAKLAESYIGKWIKQSGKVANVASSESMRTWEVYFADSRAEYIVSLAFDQTWADRVSVLKRGEQISVLGQIGRFDGSHLHLVHCELLA